MAISIYQYENYRTYLKDFYQESKKAKSCFSYRYFARKAGFSSSNFLYLVISGKRNISAEYFKKFAHAINLSREESRYFEVLIYLNQAKDIETRKYYNILLDFLKKNQGSYIEDNEFIYFSRWFYPVIGRYIQENPESETISIQIIQKTLGNRLTSKDISDALKHLRKHDIVLKDSGKKYLFNNPVISPKGSVLYKTLAIQANKIALYESMLNKHFDLTTITLSKSEYKKIKRQIDKFKKELIEQLSSDRRSAKDAYHLNIELLSSNIHTY